MLSVCPPHNPQPSLTPDTLYIFLKGSSHTSTPGKEKPEHRAFVANATPVLKWVQLRVQVCEILQKAISLVFTVLPSI